MPFRHLLNLLRPAPPAPPAMATIPDPMSNPAGPGGSTGSCGELVSSDGRVLPLRGVTLRAEARAGVARVVLEQRFVNPHADALHVTYRLPLPADAAVSGYAFVLAGRRVVGEVDRKAAARQRFEQALLEGKSAGIVEQERSSLFTQELGNVPPHAEVVAELTLDQRLLWLAEGAWEWRFPTTIGTRYVGGAGQVADAARLEVPVAVDGLDARLQLQLVIEDALAPGGRVESPSHPLRSGGAHGGLEVALEQSAGVRLDRDVVVRWPVALAEVGATVAVGRPAQHADAYGLLTLVPPLPQHQVATRRDLILLLDTSGSMAGEPLAQLQRTARALIDTLSERDTLELIEFSSAARRWHRGAVAATASARAEAHAWLAALRAGGGTEMVAGMLEALRPLTQHSQRQVVLMTDGYIGAERAVVTQIMAQLPRGQSRVHVVGVGSSVNRTLTAGVARAGAGVELILAPGEDAERLVARLLARTAAPLVTNVEVHGEAIVATAPAFLPDLYAGSPALISLQLRPEGGALEVRGHTAAGPWRQTLQVAPCSAGQGSAALAALFAREAVEDLELAHTVAQQDRGEIDRAIEALGLRYQISTRLTTWVAVSQEATVDPSRPQRREVVAHELPHGVSAEGLGLRASSTSALLRPMSAPVAAQAAPAPASPAAYAEAPRGMMQMRSAPPAKAAAVSNESKGGGGMLSRLRKRAASAPQPEPDVDDAKRDAAPPREQLGEREESAKHEQRSEPQRLRACLRHRTGVTLVFEVDVLAALDWRPGEAVVILLADGRQLAAKVMSGTTQAGGYSLGQVLRLVVELGDEAALAAGATPSALLVAGTLVPVVVK